MSVILGIDLGTSSVKGMLLDCNTKKTVVEAQKYEVEIPQMTYAEQSPHMWWEATKNVLCILRNKYPNEFKQIDAIGFSGQMHGIVLTDEAGEPLRPAILWLDQRATKELDEIYQKISKEEMGTTFLNRVFTGFAFPSLLWVKEHEKELFNKVCHIMMPKDYIRMKMTGNIGTEMSDASASAIFNTQKREWAWEMIQRFGLPDTIFPECKESTEIAGYVTKQCAEETLLKEGIPVIYGAGDQPAQSIGNACFQPGTVIANIGTGGQISAYLDLPTYDKKLRTHTFCHAINKGYTIMGATLCSGMSLQWLKNKILGIKNYSEINEMAQEIEAGSEGLIYLPYLSGERTPHMNPTAKGMFFGLTLSHDKRHFVRAVMEGVIFSLKDSLTIFQELGIVCDTVIASGGGAGSPQWLQMQADIFDKKVKVCTVGEQACLGACILAGVGTGIFKSLQGACAEFVQFSEKCYEPIPNNVIAYKKSFERYQKLYKNNSKLMET